MKKILLFALLFIPLLSYSQEKEEEEVSKSKTLEFSEKDGFFLQTEFEDIGSVSNVKFKNIYISDILSGEKASALRIENSCYVGSGNSIDYAGTLDSDELDACIKSLKYIRDNLLSTSPALYTEVEYKSRDRVLIGAYFSRGWILYIQTKSYTSKSISRIKPVALNDIIELFENAKGKMELRNNE